MMRVHKIRLVPTAAQEDYFRRSCGVARFTYNWALAEWKRQFEAGLTPTEAALRKQLNSNKAEQFPWMLQVTKNAPQQAIKNAGAAFQHFFRRVKLKQKPGYPKFKRKGVRDSFRADNGPKDEYSDAVLVDSTTVKLPKIGVIRMRETLRFAGQVKSAIVSRMADGWYVALAVDTAQRLIPKVRGKGAIGVDLGLNALATFSDGAQVPSLRPHRAAHKRLQRLSRSLSRKLKGSANRAKARTKLARLHLRIVDVRKDALHKLTTRLATEYSTICIEDLNVRGMLRNHSRARSIADASFYEFRRQLEYKASMTGARVLVVDRFYPSSKTCSECETIQDMKRKQRMVCACGNNMDRDLNAAINIRRQALACQSVESEALASAQAAVKPCSAKQKVGSCSDARTR